MCWCYFILTHARYLQNRVCVLSTVIFGNFYDSCNNLTFVFDFAKILHISHIIPRSRSQEILELFLLTLLVPYVHDPPGETRSYVKSTVAITELKAQCFIVPFS